jgi:hypothetical protein
VRVQEADQLALLRHGAEHGADDGHERLAHGPLPYVGDQQVDAAGEVVLGEDRPQQIVLGVEVMVEKAFGGFELEGDASMVAARNPFSEKTFSPARRISWRLRSARCPRMSTTLRAVTRDTAPDHSCSPVS